jgi:hypothetical protein
LEINHRAPVLQRALSLWLLSRGALAQPGTTSSQPEESARSTP